MLLSTVNREEHVRGAVGSVRRLLRLRYLPSLPLAVVSRFSLRCWPSATKKYTPRRSGRRPIPATSPGRDRMPLGCASGAVIRLVACLDDTPPSTKKNPYYRTIARARSRPQGNVRWELDF